MKIPIGGIFPAIIDLCWHKFQWGDPFDVNMMHRKTLKGVTIGDPVYYVEVHQQGVCMKCGIAKRRKVNL